MITSNRHKITNKPLYTKTTLFGFESALLDIPATWIKINEYCHVVPKMQKETSDNFERKLNAFVESR